VARARIDERGNLIRREHGRAVDQNHVATHAECRRPDGKFDGFPRWRWREPSRKHS